LLIENSSDAFLDKDRQITPVASAGGLLQMALSMRRRAGGGILSTNQIVAVDLERKERMPWQRRGF
jgi:hypothetical protein